MQLGPGLIGLAQTENIMQNLFCTIQGKMEKDDSFKNDVHLPLNGSIFRYKFSMMLMMHQPIIL